MTAEVGDGQPQAAGERHALGVRAQRLAGALVGYNLVEAVIAIAAGAAASSIALVGFGLDSVIEMSAGLIILWQFRHPVPESRERAALRGIAIAFFALAAYVTFESVGALLGGETAETSRVGIALAVASLVVMPVLALAQRRTGQRLGSQSVVAQSEQTMLCAYLSAALLVGLVLNAVWAWWWADPVVGLIIAALALWEGWEAWNGEE